MVLTRAHGTPGLRFIVGVCLLGACIYGFYILRARQIAPELFLVPERVQAHEFPCRIVRVDGLLVCLPTGMGWNRRPDGLHFYALPDKVTGLIETRRQLPDEAAWRRSLDNPLYRTFLGETDTMDAFALMRTILEKRYSPTLMGPKERLIPSWMRGHTEARILLPDGIRALCFYTADQSLGIRFLPDRVVFVSTTGRLDQALAVGILRSITPP